MQVPKIDCKIDVYCSINPSEDPHKVEHAVSNIIPDLEIKIDRYSLRGTSKNIESLLKIYEIIHSRQSQKNYGRQLKKNTDEDSTWFYLNKQAAFVNSIALCENDEESPLGPIKVLLHSKNIERIIEWLTLN